LLAFFILIVLGFALRPARVLRLSILWRRRRRLTFLCGCWNHQGQHQRDR